MAAVIRSNIETVVIEVKAAVKREGTLWSAMVLNAVIDLTGYALPFDTLKEGIKAQEQEVKANSKVDLQSSGAYRSNKAVILGAIKLGVALRNEDDSIRGKSEVEKEIKSLKEKETPLASIKRLCTQLEGKIKELSDNGNANHQDVAIAYSLIQANFKAVDALAAVALRKAA
jgi:hypothetical protein